MDNADSEAICPICGNNIRFGLRRDNFDSIEIEITNIYLYCSNRDCNWRENWKKDKHESFIKC